MVVVAHEILLSALGLGVVSILYSLFPGPARHDQLTQMSVVGGEWAGGYVVVVVAHEILLSALGLFRFSILDFRFPVPVPVAWQ